MLFKTYNVESFTRNFYKSYFVACILLTIISISGLFSGAGILATLAGVLFIFVVAVLSLNARFRKSPFSPLFIFFTFIYLCIPICFILFKGGDYIIGDSVGFIPFDQSVYQESRALGIVFLIVCWAAVWLGIVTPKCRKLVVNVDATRIPIAAIILLGLVVAFATLLDAASLVNVRVAAVDHTFSVLSFIFFDHAYLIMAGLLLFFRGHYSSTLLQKKRIANGLSAIYIFFVCVGFLSGSKASILSVFVFLVLYPFVLSANYVGDSVAFIKPSFVILLGLISPVFFYMALLRRINYSAGVDLDVYTLIVMSSAIAPAEVVELINSIFYRLSWGGVDQYFLLFQSVIVSGYDCVVANDFFTYLVKNTQNLLLPGTPFPDAYAPTSQLFTDVLKRRLWFSDFDKTKLILSYNTQPYTLFGVFMIVFGLFSPILLYLFSAALSFVYFRFDSFIAKVVILYFFSGALSSYGFEAVIGNSGLVFVSLVFMYVILIHLSHVRFFAFFGIHRNK